MRNKTVYNIHEAKTQLSRIAEFVAAGGEVVIAKAGTPVMLVIPYDSTRCGARTLGFAKGRGTIKEEFYSPLNDEDLGSMR